MSDFASIRGLGRLTIGEMRSQVKAGARFVVFEYVLSFVFGVRRRSSPIFFIRPGESIFWQALRYNLITLVFGWWSFPFGPAFTIGAIRDNLRGGRDVSAKVIDDILAAADRPARRRKR
ncbi:MAG TPA: hypothetical protein VFF59_05270 [Anaerolineae bacterium]|nr:hypothetical protein [Anaerolineae bacterium]